MRTVIYGPDRQTILERSGPPAPTALPVPTRLPTPSSTRRPADRPIRRSCRPCSPSRRRPELLPTLDLAQPLMTASIAGNNFGWRPTRLATSVMLMLVMTVLQRLVGFGRGIVFCRWLDPEQLGQWDVAFGFHQSGARRWRCWDCPARSAGISSITGSADKCGCFCTRDDAVRGKRTDCRWRWWPYAGSGSRC